MSEEEALVRLEPLGDAEPGGVGVFAVRRIPAGALVVPFPGIPRPRPDRHSIQLSRESHLHGVGTPADELRHACDPNARVVVEVAPPARVVALRDIRRGEEVTIDYCATEDVISEPFECSCGSPRCYGKVRGYRFLDPEQRERLGEAASPWLRELASVERGA